MGTVPRQESVPNGSMLYAPSGTFKMALLICLVCLRIRKKYDTTPRGYFFFKGTSCIIAAVALHRSKFSTLVVQL